MSRYIATRAIRGAHGMVREAEEAVNAALAEHGPDAPVAFPNTAYYLPMIFGLTGARSRSWATCRRCSSTPRTCCTRCPATLWTPYLGETLDSGMATLLRRRGHRGRALRLRRGAAGDQLDHARAGGASFTSPDLGGTATRWSSTARSTTSSCAPGASSWSTAACPASAAIVGCAKSNEVAVKIVRELQRRNILIFLCGNVNGRSIIHQLQEEGVEMGYDTYIVPFGTDTISADLRRWASPPARR